MTSRMPKHRRLWDAYRFPGFAPLQLDQFFRLEEGTGEAVLNGVHTVISAGFAVIVPAGTNHNIINTGSVPMKLYTLYAPPNHRDGVVHHTRAEAEADNEHFDGKTTE
jgi:Cupin domain